MSTSVFRALRRLGPAKTRHAVGDRLKSRERRATVRVRAQQREEGEAHQDARTLLAQVVADEQVVGGLGESVQRTGGLLHVADEDGRGRASRRRNT